MSEESEEIVRLVDQISRVREDLSLIEEDQRHALAELERYAREGDSTKMESTRIACEETARWIRALELELQGLQVELRKATRVMSVEEARVREEIEWFQDEVRSAKRGLNEREAQLREAELKLKQLLSAAD